MSENEKDVPKRRFKKFENAEAWEQHKFDEEVEFYSGLTYSPNDVSDDGTFVLRSSNVKNGEIVDADNVYVNSEIVNSSNVKEGDIIVVVRNGSRSLIGKHAQVKRRMNKTVIGAFMTGIRSSQSSFINALMDTQQFSGEVEKNLGATINQITNGMFREMRFMFPDIEEQKQIGNFFNNFDNLITLHQHKLEKMKALKKAYLMDMFPAEGERKPKLRFAGFTDDWEQRKLGDIIDYIVDNRGKNPSYYCKDGIPVIDNYMIKNTLYPDLVTANRFIDEYLFDNFIRKYNQIDDILITLVGNGIGNISLFPNSKAVIIQNTLGLRTSENKRFLFFLLMAKNKEIVALDRGMAQPSIRQDEILDIDILIPQNKEQQKIGQYFSNLDNLITLHQRKLEKLQNIKKAYLNEMFI